MSHKLPEFRNPHAPSRRPAQSFTQDSHTYQVDELNSAPSQTQNRRYILRTLVLAPALLCLAIYAIVQAPGIVAQASALLNRAPRSSQSSGESWLAGASQWFPILLVLLSAAVLTCMGFITLSSRRKLRAPSSPVLVPAPRRVQTVAPEAAAMAEAAAAMATLPAKPFLVSRDERRHAAQEEIRLSRDARTSAETRAVQASRLRIMAASPSFQRLEEREPEVRFRTLPRHREPIRNIRQPALANIIKRTRPADAKDDGQPPAVA